MQSEVEDVAKSFICPFLIAIRFLSLRSNIYSCYLKNNVLQISNSSVNTMKLWCGGNSVNM